MADCCKVEQKRDEMREFVRQKAINFKEMLRPFCVAPEHQDILKKYDESQVEELVRTYLTPLYATGTLSIAQNTIVAQLNITDAVIVEKIRRYLDCFCECLIR